MDQPEEAPEAFELAEEQPPIKAEEEAKGEGSDHSTPTSKHQSLVPSMLQSWTYKIFISLAAATVIALHYAYPRTVGTYSPTTDAQTPATSATSSPVLL